MQNFRQIVGLKIPAASKKRDINEHESINAYAEVNIWPFGWGDSGLESKVLCKEYMARSPAVVPAANKVLGNNMHKDTNDCHIIWNVTHVRSVCFVSHCRLRQNASTWCPTEVGTLPYDIITSLFGVK